AALVRSAEKVFGSHQDIEWAIDQKGDLYILQSRPITALGAQQTSGCSDSNTDQAAASGNQKSPGLEPIEIFDNSNIGESYPGITTPLTFSFARKAYQYVYEQFCRLMGVSEAQIRQHAHVFPKMLGLICGRIYYNLINWYRLLSLFPGFKINRGFMEQMMGVKEALPPELSAEFDSQPSQAQRLVETARVAFLLPVLIFKWLALPIDIARFHTRVERSLKSVPGGLQELNASEIAALYRRLERQLLLRWDAPIINDFFAMVSFGVLRALCTKWFDQKHAGIANQLLCGESGIISTEPVRCMQHLADMARHQPELLSLLTATAADDVVAEPGVL